MSIKHICVNCNKETKVIEQNHCHTCYCRLKRNGVIELISKPVLPTTLTNIQNEVLDGLMLGDGSLRINKRKDKALITVTRQLLDKDYLNWQFNIFKELCLSEIKDGYRFDCRTNKIYYNTRFATRYSECLLESYNRWYPDNKKIIPKDLKLTHTIIANWFYDDGSISSRSNHSLEIRFATNGFTLDDVIFLKKLLEKRYNEKIYMIENQVNQFELIASNAATINIVKDINLVNIPGMERKKNKWKNCNFSIYEKGRTFSSKNLELKIINILESFAEEQKITISSLSKILELNHYQLSTYIRRFVTNNILTKRNIYSSKYTRGTFYLLNKVNLINYKNIHFIGMI